MKYKIKSIDGTTLIGCIELPEDRVENLSSDSAEGHFIAGCLDEIVDAGVSADQLVFAVVN